MMFRVACTDSEYRSALNVVVIYMSGGGQGYLGGTLSMSNCLSFSSSSYLGDIVTPQDLTCSYRTLYFAVPSLAYSACLISSQIR
jgi:hypothetical protein